MAYATVNDLVTRYGELDSAQQATAEALLDDAAAMLEALVDVDEDDEAQANLLKMVSCAMVHRAMEASSSDAFGVTNASYTMGPFTQSATFSNPSGDMYLTANEKAVLGIGGTRLGTIRPVIGWGSGDAV